MTHTIIQQSLWDITLTDEYNSIEWHDTCRLELILYGKRIIDYGIIGRQYVRNNIKNMMQTYRAGSPYYVRITYW